MKWTRILCTAMACALGLLVAGAAQAASSISAPLTSFDAGNFTTAIPVPPRAITYDASGAHFGTASAGDGGRNFQRTISNDYATVPFKAEITFELSSAPAINDNGTPNDPSDDFPIINDNGTPGDPSDDFPVFVGDSQAVFFGLGAGSIGIFATPDWDTTFSSASFWPETGNDHILQFTNASDGLMNDNGTPGDPSDDFLITQQSFFDVFFDTYTPGIHRFQMTYDPATKLLTGALDKDYAGGPFVADVIGSPSIDTSSLFGATGWPSDPSRIWFGGDDGAIFRDLRIVVGVVPEPATWTLLLLGIATLARGRRLGRR